MVKAAAAKKRAKKRNSKDAYRDNYAFITPEHKQPQFIRMYRDLYESEAYRTLSYTARDVFIGLVFYSRMYEDEFTATYSKFNKRWSKSTFAKAIKELEEHGILKAERKGYFDYYTFKYSHWWQSYESDKPPRKVSDKSMENLRKGVHKKPP